MNGAQKLARFKQILKLHGEYVTVTRRAAATGGAPTTQTLRCLPEPLTAAQGNQLGVEGSLNLSDSNAYDFVFAGDADVRESVDTVTFQGQVWKVLNINPGRDAGTSFTIHLFCSRFQTT